MLSRLVVKNFKSIGEMGVDIPLKPLTFLVGPNGSGKSSILQAIALASQRGQREGRLVAFADPFTFIHKHMREVFATIQMNFDETTDYQTTATSGARWKLGADGSVNFNWLLGEEPVTEPEKAREVAKQGEEFFTKTYYLYAERGLIPDKVPDGAYDWVGARGEHLLTWLSRMNSNEYAEQWNKLSKWTEKFGVKRPRGKPAPRAPSYVSADFVDPVLQCPIELSQASMGARQAVVFLAQIAISKPGSLVMIEEPEASLHPEAQVDTCQILAEVVREGVQVITSTHSSFLLLGLPLAIRQGLITSADTAVYEVAKGSKGTSAKQLRVDKDGYIRGWVPTFRDVERDLLRQWTKHLPEK